MKTANKILLKPFNDKRLNKYTNNDKKYTITAIPITTNKFEPSGSLKNKNKTFEHKIDVIAKMSNDIILDLKYILVIY